MRAAYRVDRVLHDDPLPRTIAVAMTRKSSIPADQAPCQQLG
jgi:hypothetical protein